MKRARCSVARGRYANRCQICGYSARAAGWSDEALYFAITVCALFNFYNRWVDASGVHALSDEAHRLGGKRSALHGYVRT